MSRKPFSVNGKFKYRLNSWKYNAAVRFFLFAALILLFYVSLEGSLISPSYNLEKGERSQTTIYAPSTLENSIATLKAKDEAEQSVQPVYASVSMKTADLTDILFDKFEQVNGDNQVTLDQKVDIYRVEIPTLFNDFYDRFLRINGSLYTPSLLDEIRQQVNGQPYRIPEDVFFKIPRFSSSELTEMRAVTKNIVNKLMADQIVDAQSARSKVAEMVNSSALSGKSEREMVQEIARFVMTPNKFYDEDATKQAKADARNHTPSVYINKGDILVMKGQLITEEIYQQLEHQGLLKQATDYWQHLGIAMLAGLFAIVLHMFIRHSRLPISGNNAHLLMLVLIFILTVAGMKVVSLGQSLPYDYVGFLAPVAMGSMLIAILIEPSIAFTSSILFSILASVVFNLNDAQLFDFRYGLVSFIACFVSIFAIYRASQRGAILKAGIMASLASCLAVGAMLLIGQGYDTKGIVLSLSFAFASGLITAVLVVGLLPFFEVSFGILSALKLVELSNPNHPLLRKLLTETPGTYHHSVMVGNLSEAAAEAIGANGLLCRVGSFYHDIGKTRRPSYFIENQGNIENPHDRIEPQLSKSIIIAHARDGVEMLKEHRMPKQICDIAEQHHGTTLLKFFYHKALRQQEEKKGVHLQPVSEAEYRYPGPKAQSKEAAIVGISDCVEAAVRSLRNPTIEQIGTMVQKIIKNRVDDNQFNECDLTLKELETISRTLQETLLGIFHSRIEYPEDAPVKSQGEGA